MMIRFTVAFIAVWFLNASVYAQGGGADTASDADPATDADSATDSDSESADSPPDSSGPPGSSGDGPPQAEDRDTLQDRASGRERTRPRSGQSDSDVDDALLLEAASEGEAAVSDTAVSDAAVPVLSIDGEDFELPSIRLRYVPEPFFHRGGSAQSVDDDQLKAFRYDDPQQVLLQTPGVYLRNEDGFGLRPNIGIRGANSDRSKKVTLLEDGILFAPAPYSAPAAYYFPLMARIVGVDVYKGSGTLRYGPNTIGGAVNFRTRPIPQKAEGAVDLSYGIYDSYRAHAHYGARNKWAGVLVEGALLGSGGFKEINGHAGNSTGFTRGEFNIVGAVNNDPNCFFFHELELRAGYSREYSNETYLGLSDEDFRLNSRQRYSASALDRMTWWRTQFQLRYRLTLGDHVRLSFAGYRHDYDRSWRRLNRFRDGPSLISILNNPTGRRALYADVLRGRADSASVRDPFQTDEDLLLINNDRRYVSQGVQGSLLANFETGKAKHDLEVAVRLHADAIDRHHFESGYQMRGGVLAADGLPAQTVTDNVGDATALSLHAIYALELWSLTISPGLRVESIHTALKDTLGKSRTGGSQTAFLPGLGLHFAFSPAFGILAGVHRGFSPVAPGQHSDVNPETSWNYELGVRYQRQKSGTLAELIGFYNDYNNILGNCTGSSGCPMALLDRQFNGGQAEIIGFEAALAHVFELESSYQIPLRFTATFTNAVFSSSFRSDDPQFGEVVRGDELPYVPPIQFQLQSGLTHKRFAINLSGSFVSSMREEAGQGQIEAGALAKTDAYFLLDAKANYQITSAIGIYLKIDNLLNTQAIVARRPFGARPNKPFQFWVGATAKL